MSEFGSAKLYVYEDGETSIQQWGTVSEQDMKKIHAYIKINHKLMYKKWAK